MNGPDDNEDLQAATESPKGIGWSFKCMVSARVSVPALDFACTCVVCVSREHNV